MRITFASLDEMISEMKEKGVSEVRLSPMYEERYSKSGLPLLKLLITVQAIASPQIILHFEKITFRGIKPLSKEEIKRLFEENLMETERIKSRLSKEGFNPRPGYLSDE